MNVVKQILAANAGRDPVRLAQKYRRLRQQPLAFLRGTAALWHARLPLGEKLLRQAPAAWACGDAHAENYGSFKSDDRQVHFDLNDFDEAALTPASWDPLRGATSLLLLAPAAGVPAELAARAADGFIASHAAALVAGHPRWVDRDSAEPPVRGLLEAVRQRRRADFLAGRSSGRGLRRRLRCDGRHALPATTAEQAAIRARLAAFAAGQADPDFWQVLDVARRVAGTGSLGLPRWVVLVNGKGGDAGQHLLDLKAAVPSSAAARSPLPQPAWVSEAQRIVTLQQRLQAVPIARLQVLPPPGRAVTDATDAAGGALVMRALLPSEDRIDLGGTPLAEPDLLALARVQGRCLAWAQLRASGRQGSATADELADAARRGRWQRGLPDLARQMAARVQADWQAYAAAYDDGAFGPAPAG